MGKVWTVSHRTLYFFLFALSGFSGLIYESIWTQYLKLFLGHAAYAQSLVLAIFMAGLAAGSYISSRYSLRWQNPLRVYAFAEGAIGVFALAFHEIFSSAISVSYSSVIPQLRSPALIEIYKWSLSSILILPQTVLLGMTFPLMSAGILRAFPEKPGRSISLLYFTNSIGAVFGVLASGFVLIRLAGLPWTMGIAGVINISVATTVLMLIKDMRALPSLPDSARVGGPSRDKKWFIMLLAVSLFTGTASFIYEIGWIRMLSLVLGSSTHSFELMLSSFILGLALGGLWIQRRIEKIPNIIRYLAGVQIIMGVLAVSTLPVYGNSFEVMKWLMARLEKSDAGYALFNLSSHAISLTVMLPATFCAGMTLPLITYALIRRGHGEGSIGAVYASNTVGAILGVFFAIHAGMPYLGLKGLLIFGAALDIALGLTLAWTVASAFPRAVAVAVSTGSAMVLVLAGLVVELDAHKMASGVYRQGQILHDNVKVLYQKDGKTASVSLTLSGSSLSIRTNGKSDAAIGIAAFGAPTEDESTMVLLGALPLSIYPEARTVANIGFGSGLTTHTLLGSPGLEKVDTIEIESCMVEGAKKFGPIVERAFTDRRSHIYIDDAKTFFSARQAQYDIIVSEPSNPWVSGVGGLFSEEFYDLVGHHLTEKGLFVQWVQLYEIDIDLVASIFKALSRHFEDYAVYAPCNSDLIIIAAKKGNVERPGEGIFHLPAVASALRRVGILSMQDIEIRRVGSKRVLDKFFGSFAIRANSDYYPVLDQNAAHSQFMGASARDILPFTHEPLPALEMLEGIAPVRDSTHSAPTPHFFKTSWVSKAIYLREYFIGNRYEDRGLDPVVLNDAALTKRFFSDCGHFEGRERTIDSVFNIAVQMLPFLTSDEIGRIWKTLETRSCTGGYSGQEKEWISLFHAVGSRNAPEMLHYALALLNEDRGLTNAEARYLVAAGMMGSSIQGNGELCRSIWERYRVSLYGNEKPPVLFPILASLCLSSR